MSKRKLTFRVLGLLCVVPAILTFINGNDVPSQRAGLAVLGLILLFISMLFVKREKEARHINLINHQRRKIRIRNKASSLPITSGWFNQYGVMRRKLRKGGRRELGNLFVFGAPGRGKSSLLKWWLCNSDTLNFIVIDLKGELWESTAAHRAKLGKVLRFDLTSQQGHSLDSLDTNDETKALLSLQSFLPTDNGNNSDYFNEQATELALCYWRVARMTDQSALPILVKAAMIPTEAMILFTKDLVELLPKEKQEAILMTFINAFGLVWENPEADGERNSVIRSFKGAFSKLNTPSIMSTISTTTIDISDLIERRATLYITAPSTSPPYATPIQLLLGGLILKINDHVDRQRKGKQGQDVVLLGDEAGNFRIPMFSELLATGRSRGLSTAAFFQTLGQLDRYHKRGWNGLIDTTHHWTFFNSNDPQAHEFLNKRCGKNDKGRYYFEEITPKWRETQVMSLLDFDRIYPVFGEVINPYGHKATRTKMELEPPQLSELPATPTIKVFSELPPPVNLEKEDRSHIISMDNTEPETPATEQSHQDKPSKQATGTEGKDEFDELEEVEKF